MRLDGSEPAKMVNDDLIESPNLHAVRFDRHEGFIGSIRGSSIDNND